MQSLCGIISTTELTSELEVLLAARDMCAVFQPIVDLGTGEPVAFTSGESISELVVSFGVSRATSCRALSLDDVLQDALPGEARSA